MNAIETGGLVKCFKDKKALDSITLEVPENCIIGLIGRNGAGKTTLMKTLAGHLRPDSGTVRVFGEKPFDNLKVLSDILFMDDARYPDNVNLAFLFNLTSFYYPDFDIRRADRLLNYFDISQKMNIKKLSKGIKTLFSLVLAVCSRAPLTMLDEPSLGLDAAHRKEFATLLLNEYASHPRTMIISSHLISEFENLMERVILIDRGKLVFHKTLEETQGYALYLSGHRGILEPRTARWEVLTLEEMGNHLTLGVVNNFTEKELFDLRSMDIAVSPMNVQDVCINLTSSPNGGVLNAIGK